MSAGLTLSLVLLNLLAFGLELAAGGGSAALVDRWGVIPADIWTALQGRSEGDGSVLVTLLTSTLLHASWLHLAVNMAYLALFGRVVEHRVGALSYLGLYVLCGVAGSVAYVLAKPTSVVPAIGASGCVAGVIAAHLVLLPGATIGTVLPGLAPTGAGSRTVPILFALWLLLQLMAGAATLVAPGSVSAGWWPHLGGFSAGVLLAALLRRHAVRVG